MKKLWILMKVIAIILLVFTLTVSRLLPIEIVLAIGVVEIALLLLVWKRKVLQIFVVLIMLITSSGLIYIEYVAERLINYDPNVENTISFFALKDSKINSIKTAVKNNASIGVSSILNQEVVDFMQEQLATQDYLTKLKEIEGVEQGIKAFYDGEFDVLAVDQGYLATVQEYDALFLENTKVIWSVSKSNEIINLSEANVTKEPFVVYIAGVDNRDEFQASRHDVNMAAIVDPKTRNITLVSVPRDAYVQLGCFKRKALDKLTHAGVYGMECAIDSMEQLLEVEFNYYVQVEFDTVTKLVEALGTIDVWLEEEVVITGGAGTFVYPAGWNVLNKWSALNVARARHGLENGDQSRIKNQQEVLKGIFNKLLEPSSLTKIETIIKSVEGTVKTNMTGDEIFSLVRMQIKNMNGWTFNQISLSGVSATLPSFAMGGRELYMVKLDEKVLEETKLAIQNALKGEQPNPQ